MRKIGAATFILAWVVAVSWSLGRSFDFLMLSQVPVPSPQTTEGEAETQMGRRPRYSGPMAGAVLKASENGYQFASRSLAGTCLPFTSDSVERGYRSLAELGNSGQRALWYNLFAARAIVIVASAEGRVQCVLLGGT